jgi:hypothetical protein
MPLNTRALKFIHFDTPSPLPAAGVVAAPRNRGSAPTAG